ncbi:MAG: molybdenum cofactor biosynthesis protein [Deltaproteobacteria bacterium]|nr:molybdenum cofactor biosynthesis protein [Deltaproteobacteria bacterium]
MTKTEHEGDGRLSHTDARGRVRMVDISAKAPSRRRATAEAFIRLSPFTLALISTGRLPKGDAVEAARLAGIMAAKRTADLIPLCHPLLLTSVEVLATVSDDGVRFTGTTACQGPTGAEMEALTAVSVAALTLYDMVKAVERGAVIETIRLLEKSGGKSGTYRRGA